MEILFSTTLDAVIGSILKDRRQKLQLEQADVAKALSFQPSTLSKIETGSVKITVEYVAMLCGAYNIKLSDFFAILEECVNYLKMRQVLVYTPKTVQYAKTMIEASKSISQGAMVGAGVGAILSLLPLPPIVRVFGMHSAAVTLTAWLANKDDGIEVEQLPSDMVELKNDQLSQLLSALLNDMWKNVECSPQNQESQSFVSDVAK